MSIEIPSWTPALDRDKAQRTKTDRPHAGRKRKRAEGEEGHRSKSKKHKSYIDRADSAEPSIITASNESRSEATGHSTGDTPNGFEHSQDEPTNTQPQRRSTTHASEQADSTSAFKLPPSSSSPFHIQTSSLYLPLAPISQKYPLEGLCAEHLSPLILTYYPPFDGVLLSYNNARISDQPFGNDGEATLFQSIDEYAVIWAWLTAEFLLFKPGKGVWLEGHVNMQNEGHLGLVCWNLFNASIERKRLPGDWTWRNAGESSDEEIMDVNAEAHSGCFVDGKGNKIEGSLKFRVRDMESSHDRGGGFLHIEGTMLDDDEEAKLFKKDSSKRGMAGKRSDVTRDYGATSLGAPVEEEPMNADVRNYRARY